MRNVFDQYSQAENKVTHALFSALNEDRRLLRSFLDRFWRGPSPASIDALSITVQSFPGTAELPESDLESAGIPDAWITDDQGWCIVVENKVQSSVSTAQLRNHISTALRRGFENPGLLLLTIKNAPPDISSNVAVVNWKDIYQWLCTQSASSNWARRTKDFLEIIEAKEAARGGLTEGTLTSFTGFDFGKEGYSYLQAKRLIRLAITDLKSRSALMRALQIDPELPGRGAITGSGGGPVWDCLRISPEDFTRSPHYTLGIEHDCVSAMITVPNQLQTTSRRNMREAGRDHFISLLKEISDRLAPAMDKYPGMVPRGRVFQRRYPSQRSQPFLDAELSFDLRTAIKSDGPKLQPQWAEALFDSFNSRHANIQFQVGVLLPYKSCKVVATPQSLDAISDGWVACKPLVDLLSPGA